MTSRPTTRAARLARVLAAAALALFMTLVASGLASAQAAIVHMVKPGETLASIADLYYGDPRRESVLVAENGWVSPDYVESDAAEHMKGQGEKLELWK